MTNAQNWLDKKYPKNKRKFITEVLLEEGLEGHLDLSDFENLISLSSIKDTPKNGITSVNISKCPYLCFIDLYNNELTAIDTTNNPHLIRLFVGANKLTSLDVSKNPNLIELRCNWNQITELDLSKNKNLSWIACYSNKLKKLNLSGTKVKKEDYFYFKDEWYPVTGKYFRKNSIKKVTVVGDNLLIEYNDKSQKTVSPSNKELKLLKEFAESRPDKSLSISTILHYNFTTDLPKEKIFFESKWEGEREREREREQNQLKTLNLGWMGNCRSLYAGNYSGYDLV